MTSSASGPSRPTPRSPRAGSPPWPRRLLAGAAAVGLLALAGACSSGGDDGGDSSSAGATFDSADAPAAASEAYDADTSLSSRAAGQRPAGTTATSVDAVDAVAPGDPRALIKTGNIVLRSDDVATARFDVGKVLDARGGEVAEENTQSDEDGNPERVRLVLRVPVDEFDAAMEGLKGVAESIDSTTKTEDVSTEVIDTDVRVELQRRSIQRISILLDSAADLRDIVAIERELSVREADLGSLEKRQTFLADQTALATITLSIEPPPTEPDPTVGDDEDGFLAGLHGGWSALKDTTTGLLTVGGAVLPFALVLLVLAVPGRLVLRRLTHHSPSVATTPLVE